jgi:hypothetical protein
MLAKTLIWAISAAVLSALGCFAYSKIYELASATDFSAILNIYGMFGASLFACILAGLGYWILNLFTQKWADMIHNFLFFIISMGSFYLPFTFTLPETVEMPELFLALATPMHFLPMLSWLTVRPLFIKNEILI